MTEIADTYFDPDDTLSSPEVHPPPPISPEAGPDGRRGEKRPKSRACQADAVLVGLMGEGKRPDIARYAGNEALPSDEGEGDESPIRGTAVEIPGRDIPPGTADLDIAQKAVDMIKRTFPESRNNSLGAAGEALEANKVPANGNANTNSQAQDAIDIERARLRSISHELYQNATVQGSGIEETHSTPPNDPGGLPPMLHSSPQSGSTNSNGCQHIKLPSIAESLKQLVEEPLPNPNEASYSQSPGRSISRFPPGPGVASPGNSPNGLRRDIMSPSGPLFNQFSTNNSRQLSTSEGRPYGMTADYSSGSNAETPSTDQSASTPATMAIDLFIKFPCKCTFFQSTTLLYGKRMFESRGGKGFKRKNEMIRHGLVHDSPGYVCPFCPEREHKYPRPDNLQSENRHVRAHHTDKDKDDPLLRGVLAQRPEGPSKGRRRRGGN
ncbi:C2H2 type zinc finger domain-containing protein [Botrytis cinerea]